jgi:hypothetical protein
MIEKITGKYIDAVDRPMSPGEVREVLRNFTEKVNEIIDTVNSNHPSEKAMSGRVMGGFTDHTHACPFQGRRMDGDGWVEIYYPSPGSLCEVRLKGVTKDSVIATVRVDSDGNFVTSSGMKFSMDDIVAWRFV